MKCCQRLTLPPPSKLAILDGRTPALTDKLHDHSFHNNFHRLALQEQVRVLFLFLFLLCLCRSIASTLELSQCRRHFPFQPPQQSLSPTSLTRQKNSPFKSNSSLTSCANPKVFFIYTPHLSAPFKSSPLSYSRRHRSAIHAPPIDASFVHGSHLNAN